MADVMNLIPAKNEFPKMYVPVFFKDSEAAGKLELVGKEKFNIQMKFNEINPVVIKNEKIFVGPANCYSHDIHYNKIVGLDNIDLYLEMDNGSTEYVFGVSENFFYKTGAFVGVMEKEQFKKYELPPGIRVFEGESIFDAGNYLIKKYPIRSGSTVNFHCFESEKDKAACIFFIPNKRDQKSIMIDFIDVDKDEDLDLAIASRIIENDPKKEKYTEIVIKKFSDITKLCVGFFEVSTHINIFDFDGMTRLQGVSFND